MVRPLATRSPCQAEWRAEWSHLGTITARLTRYSPGPAIPGSRQGTLARSATRNPSRFDYHRRYVPRGARRRPPAMPARSTRGASGESIEHTRPNTRDRPNTRCGDASPWRRCRGEAAESGGRKNGNKLPTPGQVSRTRLMALSAPVTCRTEGLRIRNARCPRLRGAGLVHACSHAQH